ncbi:hypothetical protein [Silvania hatchlandensis]|uniref:Uncharacterized protein n=1 Tax=Silvania hatchlandensis TaxID=2926469 RepID=A0A9J6QC69_9ENTR|nr:hypothetical protein [Silvania hatchlandensis]MCU6667006.1 hypothetical protein [Silvania hatchlandensis]
MKHNGESILMFTNINRPSQRNFKHINKATCKFIEENNLSGEDILLFLYPVSSKPIIISRDSSLPESRHRCRQIRLKELNALWEQARKVEASTEREPEKKAVFFTEKNIGLIIQGVFTLVGIAVKGHIDLKKQGPVGRK